MRARLPIVLALGVVVLVAGAWRFTFWMPAASDCEALHTSTSEIAVNLRRHVDALAGRIGPRSAAGMAALEAAAQYVDDELRRAGWNPHRQPVGSAFTNVVAERGTGPRLVIGAHYDTVAASPGADDDASGVAALLEIARLLAPLADVSIRLVAFVNEEAPLGRGELRGSRVAAARGGVGRVDHNADSPRCLRAARASSEPRRSSRFDGTRDGLGRPGQRGSPRRDGQRRRCLDDCRQGAPLAAAPSQ